MERLRSRKFWVAIASALALVLIDGLELDLDRETIIAVVTIASAYLLGQSWVDARKPPTP